MTASRSERPAAREKELLDGVRQWRKQFPGSRVHHFAPEEVDLLLRIADERDQLRRDLCTEPEPKPVTDPWEESQSPPDTRTVTADMRRIHADLATHMSERQGAHWERKQYARQYGMAPKYAFQDGFWEGVQAVLNRQHRIDDLTTGQMLTELRKGPGSIYWPLLSADPKFHADCPRCNRTVLIDAEGICPTDGCQYEFQEVD